MQPLDRDFYNRPTAVVARELLGKHLVRADRWGIVGGRIVEVEAYLATGDPACHAARGMTRRNASMFGAPGTAYVYMIHAKWCFNVVTEPEGVACAVLVRAIEPLSGVARMRRRRGPVAELDLTRGPARLCQALDIDRRWDGWDLTRGESLWVTEKQGVGEAVADSEIGASPRIGISSAQELPLRFYLRNARHVSGPRKLRER